MLTDFSWLQTGQQFPPLSEVERINNYRDYKLIFENKHHEVYSNQWERIMKVIGSDVVTMAVLIALNFQKKMSLKTADFLFMEKPTYKATKGEDGETDVNIKDIVDSLDGIDFEGVIDTSRYGDAVYKIDVEGEGVNKKGTIGISSPDYLYTITEVADRKKVKGYVLAWEYETGNETDNNIQKHLKAIIHTKTTFQRKTFMMDGSTIGDLENNTTDEDGNTIILTDDKPQETGLDDFAIIPISNVKTSDRIYGISDYDDVDSVVSEIEVRVSQISKILDVHASPTMEGSADLLQEDKQTGESVLPTGNFFVRNSKDAPETRYITWEANLEANFKQIELLLKFLSTLSEMGAALFDSDKESRAALSGTALEKLYINVLAKVARIRKNYDKGFKKAIALASQIGHETVTVDQITITWKDGLPNDEKEEAEIMAIRLPNMQTMALETANIKYDEMTPEQAQKEGEKIDDDQAGILGVAIPPVVEE